jgi:hypothetical protein
MAWCDNQSCQVICGKKSVDDADADVQYARMLMKTRTTLLAKPTYSAQASQATVNTGVTAGHDGVNCATH